jgi:hypothetical protein
MVWVKSMGRQILAGNLNLVNTSFPVLMFEPRSYLEKLADTWAYPGEGPACLGRSVGWLGWWMSRLSCLQIGHRWLLMRFRSRVRASHITPPPNPPTHPPTPLEFINAAAAAPDPLDRMKLLTTWVVAGMWKGFDMWKKPFNPILGETWQATMEGGVSLFMEQVGAMVIDEMTQCLNS